MSFLSEILVDKKVIPEPQRSQASICCECGKPITKGGMWAMKKYYLGICDKCAPVLLDCYIDTLLDTGEIQENNDAINVQKLSNDIIERYRRKKEKKEKQNKKHM